MDENLAVLIKNIGTILYKDGHKFNPVILNDKLDANEIQKILTNLVKLVTVALKNSHLLNVSKENDFIPNNINNIPLMGPRGPRGLVGEKGDSGDKGDKGDKGDTGDSIFEMNNYQTELKLNNKTLESLSLEASNNLTFNSENIILNGNQISSQKNIAYLFEWEDVPTKLTKLQCRIAYITKNSKVKLFEDITKNEICFPVGIICTKNRIQDSLVLNSAHLNWNKKYYYRDVYKYLDDEGNIVESFEKPELIDFEIVTKKVVNPSFNPKDHYVSRLDRIEWVPVIIQGSTQLIKADKREKINPKWIVHDSNTHINQVFL